MQNNLPSETTVASQLIARNPVFLKLRFTLILLNIFATLIEINKLNINLNIVRIKQFFISTIIHFNKLKFITRNQKPSLPFLPLLIFINKKIEKSNNQSKLKPRIHEEKITKLTEQLSNVNKPYRIWFDDYTNNIVQVKTENSQKNYYKEIRGHRRIIFTRYISNNNFDSNL